MEDAPRISGKVTVVCTVQYQAENEIGLRGAIEDIQREVARVASRRVLFKRWGFVVLKVEADHDFIIQDEFSSTSG